MDIKYFSQIFSVDAQQYPNGYHLDSVHMCFKDKDDSLPILMQIRPVVNDLPDLNRSLYGSDVTLYPPYIAITSANAVSANMISNTAAATKFTFDSPLYLTPGKYAISLKTASPKYNVYTASKTENLLGTSNGVVRSVSPVRGVGGFFKTQNTEAWETEPNKMLAFKLQKVRFDPRTTKQVTLNTTAGDILNDDFADVIHVSTNQILPKGTAIDYRFIAKRSDNTIDSANTILETDKNIYFTTKRVKLTANQSNNFNIIATLTTTDANLTPKLDATRLSLTAIKYNINAGELSNNLIYVLDPGFYGNSTVPTVTISAPDAPDGIQANAIVNFNTTVNTIANVVLTNVGRGYYSTPNVTLQTVFTTPNSNGSIYILGETSPSGGNALAKYITRKVQLADGFDASDLKVWLTANRQVGTEIQVYYKILSAQDPNQNFDLCPWKRMTIQQNSTTYSKNNLDNIEYTYVANGSPSLTYTNDAGTVFTDFSVFAIKICLFAKTTLVIPYVKSFRAIALA